MSYLQRLPVSILKVDKSFVEGIERDLRAQTLVHSVIVMAEALGIEVVIEGVERESQLRHLSDLASNCSAQGYLFARPMPYDDMVTLLRHTSSLWPPLVGGRTVALN